MKTLSNEFSRCKKPHGVKTLLEHAKTFQPANIGRPQLPDSKVASFLVEHLDSNLSAVPECNTNTSFFTSMKIEDNPTTTIELNDGPDEILLPDLTDEKQWLKIYDELKDKPDVLRQLTDPTCNVHLDILNKANLLRVIPQSHNVFFRSRGEAHFFYLASVATLEEVKEMSLLLSLATLLNTKLVADNQGVRGWTLFTLGKHQFRTTGGFAREWAKNRYLDVLARKLLAAFMIGIAVMERRMEMMVSMLFSGCEKIFEKQRREVSLLEERWQKENDNQKLAVPTPLELSSNAFASVLRGTLMHRDRFDVGLSPIYYVGVPGKNAVGGGVGLPEKKIIIQKNAGGVIAIPSSKYWHMSCESSHLSDMMVAAYTHKTKTETKK
jgi:hypothetical protein